MCIVWSLYVYSLEFGHFASDPFLLATYNFMHTSANTHEHARTHSHTHSCTRIQMLSFHVNVPNVLNDT